MKTLMMKLKVLAAVVAGVVALTSFGYPAYLEIGKPAEFTDVVRTESYKMWSGVDLHSLTNFTCYFGGGSVGAGARGFTNGYFYRWTSETDLEVQFQKVDGYLKCVAVRFSQVGEDVYATRVWSDYCNIPAGESDYRGKNNFNYGVGKGNSNDGYQASQIKCCVTGEGRAALLDGRVTIGEDIACEAKPAISQGKIPLPVAEEVDWRTETTDLTQMRRYSCLMWRNTPLAAVTNLVGWSCAPNIDNEDWVKAWFPHWLSPTEVVVQFQNQDGAHLKCALIKFLQLGNDIYAVRYGKQYVTASLGEGGRDFFLNPSNPQSDMSGYEIEKVKADILEFEVEADDYAETVDIPQGGFEEVPLTWMGKGQYAENWKVTLNVASCGDERGEYLLVAWEGGVNPENVVFGHTPRGGSFFFIDEVGGKYATAASVPPDVTVTGVGYRQTKSGLAVILR